MCVRVITPEQSSLLRLPVFICIFNSNISQLETNTVDIGLKINMRTRIYTPIFNSVIIYSSSVIVEFWIADII